MEKVIYQRDHPWISGDGAKTVAYCGFSFLRLLDRVASLFITKGYPQK
jgi:hypothetical protein